MDKVERRQRAEEAHQEREREDQAAALRQIRDDPNATPGNAWRLSSCLWSCRNSISISCEKGRATWIKLYRSRQTSRMYKK